MQAPRQWPRPKQWLQNQELFFEPRGTTIHCDTSRVTNDSQTQRHCVLIHGWNSPSRYMNGIKEALKILPAARDWHFWTVEYRTHLQDFTRGANDIKTALRAQPFDFSHTVFVGFSMGGLVARQMISDGFACQALVTICTPHVGTAPWIPPHSAGTIALSRWSKPLRTLNANPVDIANRDRYRFFAITYKDRFGYHDDDAIVTARSALGARLGNVALRRKIHLDYGQNIGRRALGSPHARGLNPTMIAPVFRTCAEILSTQ